MPIVILNIQKLAEEYGWDELLSSWWPTMLSELSRLGESSWTSHLAVAFFCLAAGMWLNYFLYRKSPYVLHEERLFHKQGLKERELRLQESGTAENAHRKPTQGALDRLAELRNEGIDTVYAPKVKNEQDFEKWKRTKQDWESRIRGFIEQNFPRADYLFASDLGVVHLQGIEQAFNEEHLRELCFVIRQIDIVEQILNSYRK